MNSNKAHANALVFDVDGQLVYEYQKIHLFDAEVADSHSHYRESEEYQAGNQAKVFDIAGIKVGIAICYDLRFSQLFCALRRQQAQLIVVPAAFTYTTGKVHWLTLLKARAIEFGVYILAANQTGWHDAKRRTYGHSCLIDPWGEVVSVLEEQQALLTGSLDLAYLTQIRQALPSFQHQRDFNTLD